MNKNRIKSHALLVGFGLALLFRVPLHAQVVQDSTGHIPALRTHIVPHSDAATWWQRVGEQHLLDFSEAPNKIVVDPIVQVMAGVIQIDGDEPGTQTIWDNIRGARFQAELDGQFHIGGELLERQGVAEPLLGLWAVQNRIPGWGRSKLGRNSGWNTVDQAYYDVSRARGWTGWSDGVWSADAGIDALHFGAGRTSALISKTSAPAPYARIGFDQKHHRTEFTISQWLSDERGPMGETAESLLNRSHIFTLQHAWNPKPKWLLQGAYQFIREKSTSIADSGWSSLGLIEGDEYRALRHVIGLESQYHFTFLATGQGVVYVQQSFDLGGAARRVLGSEDEHRSMHALTSVAGLRLNASKFELLIEAYQRSEATCSTCFEYRGIGPDLAGPKLASLNHAGMSVHGIWSESLRIQGSAQLAPRWNIALICEQNNAAAWAQLQSRFTIQPTWPMELFCNVGKAVGRLDLASNYQWCSFGIHAAVAGWQ